MILVACDGSGEIGVPGTRPDPEPTVPTGPTEPGTNPTEPGAELALDAISASVHPEIGSILIVTWTQSVAAEVHLEFSVDAGIWLRSPVRALDAGPQTELVLGVPFETSVTWRISAGSIASADQVTTTGAPSLPLPPLQISIADPARMDQAGAPYLFTTLASSPDDWDDPWWALIYDRAGRPVWAKRGPRERVMMHSRVARDGRSLYLDHNSYWAIFDGGGSATIEQTRIDGSVTHTFATPGLHHPFTDLPDGSIAYGAAIDGYDNELIQVVYPDDSAVTLWDCEAWLDDIGESGFCMSNTLTFHEPTNTLWFSFWSSETIVEVDASTGAVSRWFGHLDGSYAFDPPQSAFWWQHGGVITETGTLLTSSDLNASGIETVVREYEIDDATQTLHEVWSFGVGDRVYGGEMGEAVRLPNGNTWHNYGELARLREAAPDGTVVWDLVWDSEAIGRSMPIVDLYLLQ